MKATVINFVPEPQKGKFKSLETNGGFPRKESRFARSTERFGVICVSRGETGLLIMTGVNWCSMMKAK